MGPANHNPTAEDLIAAFSQQPILIVGDVMLDEYIWGDVRRISPEAPVPVVQVRRRTCRPGGAGNVAANVAALGGAPLLCGVVGDDPGADQLAEALAADGVAAELIRAPGRPTIVKSRVIAHSQQMLRLDSEADGPLAPETAAAIERWCAGAAARAGVCVLSDYAKGALTPDVCQALIELARERGLPVVVDPKGRDYRKYAGATVITPNTGELALAVGQPLDDAFDVERAAAELRELLPGTSLLVTRGAEGMTLYRDGAAALHIPARARTVYDVTGAGDTVVATLALALASGAPLERAALLANSAAGVAVSKIGTATVSQDELRAAGA
jgi:D-beta-D-heptose 7-phosphate kinase/D-beta-D-heptose 1-phosphate adenosyltransferase